MLLCVIHVYTQHILTLLGHHACVYAHSKAIYTANSQQLHAFPSMYFKAFPFSLSHYLSIQEKIANPLECKSQKWDVKVCMCDSGWSMARNDEKRIKKKKEVNVNYSDIAYLMNMVWS